MELTIMVRVDEILFRWKRFPQPLGTQRSQQAGWLASTSGLVGHGWPERPGYTAALGNCL
jgi:hypothetical protein